MIGVGKIFPDFHMTGVDESNSFIDLDILAPNTWSVLYFYPKDFTFICPTEIAMWKESNDLIRNINHILAADCGLKLSSKLGIVDEANGVCYRATYIIDPEGVIQHVSVNALDTGRNANEVLRTLQGLKAGGLTGCEWQPGEDFVA